MESLGAHLFAGAFRYLASFFQAMSTSLAQHSSSEGNQFIEVRFSRLTQDGQEETIC